jgi:hypothetical protein
MTNKQESGPVKIETLTLDDGRRAERHTTLDANGQEVVEIFAEEKRPLKLEKRIVREFKSVVAKEIHQTVKDGEVAYEEVHATEPEVQLQLLSRAGVAHHKVVDGDYVRKEEIGALIADGVVAGVTALMEQYEPVAAQGTAAPVFRAQEVVEQSVSTTKSNKWFNIAMIALIAGQVAIFGYIYFMS